VNARDEVLSRIRTALTPPPALSVTVPRDYHRGGGQIASMDLLVSRLQDYRAVVHRCEAAQVPALLGRLVVGRVVIPEAFPPAWLAEVAAHRVEDAPTLTPQQLDGLDAVLTTCTVAVAETGTIILDGAAGQGRRALSLVPDRHVLVVRAEQVVAGVPQALQRLDPRRPQTWISGPSATSDIELQRVEGVHGPRTLTVVLVEP